MGARRAAHAFGKSFPAWVGGDPRCVDSRNRPFKGRNCAPKTETLFCYMEADMHNLVPAVGEINGLRSNYSFAMIPSERRSFGSCDMEIENRKAEPRPEIRGDIARIYKYMDWAYPGRGVISSKNRSLFEAWDRQDPVDSWECERARRIEQIQGNPNPFVQLACLQSEPTYEARVIE
jgi:deoxyribonuclease-1